MISLILYFDFHESKAQSATARMCSSAPTTLIPELLGNLAQMKFAGAILAVGWAGLDALLGTSINEVKARPYGFRRAR